MSKAIKITELPIHTSDQPLERRNIGEVPDYNIEVGDGY